MTMYSNVRDFQVLQRDANDRAQIKTSSGKIVELSVGGPYEVDGAKDVFVGDLWILAGQSNMEGCGNLKDVETPSPQVHCFESREAWAVAEEPLHWLSDSPRAVHNGGNITPRDPNRAKGSGLGLAFAKLRNKRTGAPIGLIPSAHGGTSMAQWSHALRDKGGDSLYGATVLRHKAVGGRVAGMLWYQGESDANPGDARLYADRMVKLVQSFREDFRQPELPFYYVQLGRFAVESTPEGIAGWNAIREIQRDLYKSIENSAVVTAIDLEIDDLIHIGTTGLKVIGKRLADVAAGIPSPDLASVKFEPAGNRLRVSFDNVRGGLRSAGRPSGFSLRRDDGTDVCAIYKIGLEGNDALLYLNGPPNADMKLWYGYGIDPYCNILDAEGAAIPAFGPIAVG